MSSDLLYICPVNKIITMKRNWIGSSMIVALFALLASGCGHSQRTLEFRGICVDDPQGENGLYNPGRGFRLETAVDVLHEKDTPTEELNELSAKYVADSVSLSQSYFYLTYLIGKELSEENFRTMQAYFDELQKQGKKAVLRFAYERDFMGRSPVGPPGEKQRLDSGCTSRDDWRVGRMAQFGSGTGKFGRDKGCRIGKTAFCGSCGEKCTSQTPGI